MNIRKSLYIGIVVFLLIVFLAAGTTAQFNLSNITSDVYAYIEKFFREWSSVLGAAGTVILALSIFISIYQSQRREEREKEQAIHALHDEIHWNLISIITLRFQISERLKYIEEHNIVPTEPEAPFELIETRVFDDMRSRGQLHLLEEIRMDIIPCYKLITDYNMGRRFKSYHLELLAHIYEGLDRAIRDLEAKFKFLPHYVKDRSQKPETENVKGDSAHSNCL